MVISLKITLMLHYSKKVRRRIKGIITISQWRVKDCLSRVNMFVEEKNQQKYRGAISYLATVVEVYNISKAKRETFLAMNALSIFHDTLL